MNESLEETYFIWLYGQNVSLRARSRNRTYWTLMRQMHSTEFVWFIPNDDNRVEDGKLLRYEFMEEAGLIEVDRHWMSLGCSFLEMMVGMSRRLSFETDSPPDAWFWHLMENINLTGYTDSREPFESAVDEAMQRVIWRTYLPNGVGGLYPLRYPDRDQTKVELWYQMCAYVIENT